MSKNNTHIKFISPQQVDVVNALLESKTIAEAAVIAGVGRSTVYRWFKQSEFMEALRISEGVILDRAARRLILLADKAIGALESVLDEPTQKGATQKRYAAAAILDNIMRLWELRNLEKRLVDLEGKLNGNQE